MTTATDRVAAALAEANILGEIRTLDSSARTAALAAEQLGVPVGAIANSLIFNAEGRPLLVMASGAHRVDTKVLADLVSVNRVERASPDFVREHTGQTIGGVAPAGHLAPIRTLIDSALMDYPKLWAAGGHPHSVFPLTFDELVRLTSGVVAIVTSPK